MEKIRAFFLTSGLGLLAVSLVLLVYRPEPADMRFREFFGGVMTVGALAGFLSLMIFSNKWRIVNFIGTALFGLGVLAFYLAGRFGGHTVGSAGWGIGLILISAVFPTALILMCISGVVTLTGVLTINPGSKIGLFAGLAAIVATIAVLSGIMMISPDINKLISSLHDPKAEVRIQSIHQLGMIDNPRGKYALVELLHDPDPTLRAAAAMALGNPPAHHMVIDPLTKALGDENSEVRRNAARSLGAAIGVKKRKMYSRTADALLETLKDENPEVQAAAADALGWIGEKRAVEPLIELLNNEAVRFQAHNALITITGQRLSDDPAEWRAWLERK